MDEKKNVPIIRSVILRDGLETVVEQPMTEQPDLAVVTEYIDKLVDDMFANGEIGGNQDQ